MKMFVDQAPPKRVTTFSERVSALPHKWKLISPYRLGDYNPFWLGFAARGSYKFFARLRGETVDDDSIVNLPTKRMIVIFAVAAWFGQGLAGHPRAQYYDIDCSQYNDRTGYPFECFVPEPRQ